MMKKIFGVIFVLFLFGCASTIEPASQINNPAKTDASVKVIYSNANEIYILSNLGAIFGPVKKLHNKPNNNYFKTAFNHCTSNKKNTYILHKRASPIPYKLTMNYEYAKAYAASAKDLYDWRQFHYNGTRYDGYRFVCSNSKNEALNIDVGSDISLINYSDSAEVYRKAHRGTLTAIEQKRFISDQEIAENKQKALEKKIREAKLKEEKRLKKISALELNYKEDCKGSTNYEKCLFDAEKKYLEEQKALDIKLASMTSKERHAYNCSETFNFKKGTEKFNDCVFKLYTAELDLQKLELEKEVAEAQIKAAATEQARAEAVANAQIAAAKSAKRSSDLNNSIQLMKLGSSLLGGSTSSSSSSNSFDINNRTRTTCRVVGGFLNCY
tara:strand:- start:57 stop:1208 length:1152 start_codon:yes stop_codon:yes gene_type:complete